MHIDDGMVTAVEPVVSATRKNCDIQFLDPADAQELLALRMTRGEAIDLAHRILALAGSVEP